MECLYETFKCAFECIGLSTKYITTENLINMELDIRGDTCICGKTGVHNFGYIYSDLIPNTIFKIGCDCAEHFGIKVASKCLDCGVRVKLGISWCKEHRDKHTLKNDFIQLNGSQNFDRAYIENEYVFELKRISRYLTRGGCIYCKRIIRTTG
jgi:hypothetical protein